MSANNGQTKQTQTMYQLLPQVSTTTSRHSRLLSMSMHHQAKVNLNQTLLIRQHRWALQATNERKLCDYFDYDIFDLINYF